MNRWGMLLTLGALAICGGASAATISDLETAIAAVDADCQAAHFPTRVQLSNCFNTEERVVWVKYAPEALPYFDEWAAQRLRIVSAFEANQITLTDAKAELDAHQAVFRSQINTLAQQEAANAQQAAQARQAQRLRDSQALDYLAAAARANADAQAARAAISAQPRITHTTCQPVFGTVQCTTTP